MDIRTLKFFIKVAELQNFSLAASDLGYSQSNISTQIIQLENEIGVPLFNRIGHQISLTQWGEVFLPYARQIVELECNLANFMKSDKVLGGNVRLGIVESIFSALDVNTFVRFHSRFPNLKIDITVDCTEALKSNLSRGRLDVACIIDKKQDPGIWATQYSVDTPIVLIGNPENVLYKLNDVPLTLLAEQDFVAMEDNAPYNIYGPFAEEGIEIKPFLKMQSAKVACELVERNNYVSLLPLYVVQPALKTGKVIVLPCKKFNLYQSVQIVCHKNKVRTPQINGVIDILSASISELVTNEGYYE